MLDVRDTLSDILGHAKSSSSFWLVQHQRGDRTTGNVQQRGASAQHNCGNSRK